MKCTFCKNPIDGSNEHIFPDSINGKLQSKNIICSVCNSKVFGENVDPVLAEIFKPIIHALKLKNARGLIFTDESGNKFLIQKGGEAKQLKPEIKFERVGNEIHFSIKGEEKDIVNYLKKRQSRSKNRFSKSTKLEIKYFEVKEVQTNNTILSAEYKIEITPRLILELNKIALEFYAHSGLDLDLIQDLAVRVHLLDENLDNVLFCNLDGQVRIIEQDEISHLIILRHDKKSNTVFCYIELFNIICAYIPLVEGFKGSFDENAYRQDVITGQTLDIDFKLNISPGDISSIHTYSSYEEFGLMSTLFFQRLATRQYAENFDNVFKAILDEILNEIEKGKLVEKQLREEYLKRVSEYIGQTSAVGFPYVVEDFKLELDDRINHINSNISEDKLQKFLTANDNLIGLNFLIEEKILFFKGFFSTLILERNNVRIHKVFCLLENKEDGTRQYIQYYPFFEALKKSANSH
ncbi:MAG: HNH endonuclease [Flavobacterium sp.]|nr:HNH endonuclease [Flavobacterium sp.]